MDRLNSSTGLSFLASADIFPMTGGQFESTEFTRIDLAATNPDIKHFDLMSYTGLDQFIRHSLAARQARAGVGGYLEKRIIYQASDHFDGRDIHMGVDVWVPAGTIIYAPLPGRIHSLAFNDAYRDYGATIVLSHSIGERTFYTLYGHIDRDSMEKYMTNEVIDRGQPLCRVGCREENGGWVPHLHFQYIRDMLGNKGDFPGVIAREDLDRFRKICPDPTPFFDYIRLSSL